MNVFDQNNETYTHLGSAAVLEQTRIDPNGVVSSFTDRTPPTLVSDTNNQWQFSNVYDTGTSDNTLLAHAAPNALDISSDVAGDVFFGDVTDTAALTATSFTPTSGGVVNSGAYTWAYGSNGVVEWSPPNDPASYGGAGSGTAAICAAKIVKGMPLRAGAGNGPTTLFWSLNSLERATFVGGTSIFNFDTIEVDTSILSSASVIVYNGVYFWIGTDSFLLYNGVVRELPNDMNVNFFFDNLNYDCRNKVYAIKQPRWGEIWWCAPLFGATECNWAIIYNVRENTWYDTPLPNGGRSCGQYAQVFRSPLMGGVDVDSTTAGYKLWQHEFGNDSIDGTRVTAIDKYIETAEFDYPDMSPQDSGIGSKTNIVCNRVEPDFVQTGDMDLVVLGRQNARVPQVESDPYTFVPTPTTTAEQLLDIREANRYLAFRFRSNVQGGSFQWGKLWWHTQPGSGRITT